jgi:uncharacterized membrane protein (DUF485 family)
VDHHHHLTPSDWDAVAKDPQFQGLIASKRRFIVPATIFFLIYYLALPVLTGFYPDYMSRPVVGPLTLAFAFALSQFVMAWLLLALYLWRARSFDRAERQIVDTVRKEFA